MPLAKRARKGYLKREPRPAAGTAGRGWHGAVCAPLYGCLQINSFSTPTRLQRAGVNSYLALDASNRTRAVAASRVKASFIRMAMPSFSFLRRADAYGQRAAVREPCYTMRVAASSKVFFMAGGRRTGAVFSLGTQR